jgi:hypothetical protein
MRTSLTLTLGLSSLAFTARIHRVLQVSKPGGPQFSISSSGAQMIGWRARWAGPSKRARDRDRNAGGNNHSASMFVCTIALVPEIRSWQMVIVGYILSVIAHVDFKKVVSSVPPARDRTGNSNFILCIAFNYIHTLPV